MSWHWGLYTLQTPTPANLLFSASSGTAKVKKIIIILNIWWISHGFHIHQECNFGMLNFCENSACEKFTKSCTSAQKFSSLNFILAGFQINHWMLHQHNGSLLLFLCWGSWNLTWIFDEKHLIGFLDCLSKVFWS